MKTTVWYLLVICLIKVKEMVNYIFADQVVKVEEERGPRRGIVKMDSLEVEGEVVYDRWSWLILYHIIMESNHTMVSDREGVIVQAKREDRLHSGRLKVTDTRC